MFSICTYIILYYFTFTCGKCGFIYISFRSCPFYFVPSKLEASLQEEELPKPKEAPARDDSITTEQFSGDRHGLDRLRQFDPNRRQAELSLKLS
jgi:hypothetical protein